VAHAGQEIEGYGGFRLKLITTGAESGGELLEMEATYGEGSALPPEHFHPSQDERFEVLDGAVLTVIGGVKRRYEKGETFDVPAGTRLQMTGDGVARVRWQVRPALRTAEFFERLYSGAGEDLRDEFREEIRFTAM
jgi:mannose-6-phosphate isomerase-like protein (cupin superfamily)